jgi:uncharacterized protein (DUF362 family)
MSEHEAPRPPPSRRDFLIRTFQAAVAVGATAVVGRRFRDLTGPAASTPAPALRLPSFSIPNSTPALSIATGTDRVATVNRALAAVGGLRRFIAEGDRVLIKVNAAFATPPALCATSHPALVAEVVRLCLDAGAQSVVVTDNPINDPTSCFELTGIGPAARAAGAKVVVPNDSMFRPVTLTGGRLIRDWPFLFAPFARVNKLIGIAPVKNHHRAGASLSLKNWYGLLGGRRNVFHQDINNIVKELALLVRPTLVILDGTMAMMTNGPTGGSLSDLKAANTMIVSTDPVAADVYGAALLGKKSADVPYITSAAEAGAGTANVELLNPVRVST